MKPSSPHHKTIRVDFSFVESGYGGKRQIPQAGPGWWQIIGANTEHGNLAPWPTPGGWISIIVAPYTRGLER